MQWSSLAPDSWAIYANLAVVCTQVSWKGVSERKTELRGCWEWKKRYREGSRECKWERNRTFLYHQHIEISRKVSPFSHLCKCKVGRMWIVEADYKLSITFNFTLTILIFSLFFCRHQQVPVDGAYRWFHWPRPAHQGAGLLHTTGRVPCGQGGKSHTPQLSHVQDVLLQVRLCLHWVR